MHPLGQAIWGNIWKDTVGKTRTKATNLNEETFENATVEQSKFIAIDNWKWCLAVFKPRLGIGWPFINQKLEETEKRFENLLW